MSRNGSGTYNLPAGNPVVSGTTITTTWANTTLNDIASSLTGSVAADGQTPMTGDLNMANNKVIALATPTATTDAVTKAYADALVSALGTMSTQNANAVAITGGTINGTTLGATTRADGKFTTLAANGDVSFTSTGFLLIPSGTTAQRPASPAVGEIRYNTTLSQYEGYSGSAWSGLGNGAAGSNTQIQYNNGGALAGSSTLTYNGTTLLVPSVTFSNSSVQSYAAGLGSGSQTWQNVSSSRVSGTTYTNSTGYTIMVSAFDVATVNIAGYGSVTGTVNSVTLSFMKVDHASATDNNGTCILIVPPGATYSVTWSGAYGTTYWYELR